jgi:arylsulfatase
LPGQHDAVLEYEALGKRAGRGRILVDGLEMVAWSPLSPTLMVGPFEGFDVGLDRRAPVFWELFQRHGVYRYSGKIDEVWIDPGQRATA